MELGVLGGKPVKRWHVVVSSIILIILLIDLIQPESEKIVITVSTKKHYPGSTKMGPYDIWGIDKRSGAKRGINVGRGGNTAYDNIEVGDEVQFSMSGVFRRLTYINIKEEKYKISGQESSFLFLAIVVCLIVILKGLFFDLNKKDK